MWTYQLWQGKEGKKTVRRLIREDWIIDDDDNSEDAKGFFAKNVKNLRHIGDVDVSNSDDATTADELGCCWVEEDD